MAAAMTTAFVSAHRGMSTSDMKRLIRPSVMRSSWPVRNGGEVATPGNQETRRSCKSFSGNERTKSPKPGE
eukprot:5571024-Prymnesium_polylepis.1